MENHTHQFLKSTIEVLSLHVDIGLALSDNGHAYRAGSLTLLKMREKYLAVGTAHQFKDTDTSKICIGSTAQKFGAATSSEAWQYIGNTSNESEIKDLMVFDFTSAVCSGFLSAERFFPVDLEEVERLSSGGDFFGFLVVGVPYSLVEMEIDNEDHARWTRYSVKYYWDYCSFEATYSDQTIERYVSQSSDPLTNADGMSGGANFCLFVKDNKITPAFNGIITRGGNGNYWCLSALSIITAISMKA